MTWYLWFAVTDLLTWKELCPDIVVIKDLDWATYQLTVPPMSYLLFPMIWTVCSQSIREPKGPLGPSSIIQLFTLQSRWRTCLSTASFWTVKISVSLLQVKINEYVLLRIPYIAMTNSFFKVKCVSGRTHGVVTRWTCVRMDFIFLLNRSSQYCSIVSTTSSSTSTSQELT